MTTPGGKTHYFTAALLIGSGVIIAYLCFRVFQPFLAPVVWALVLAVLLHPLYEPAVRRLRSPWLASMSLCILGILLLGIPVFYLITALPGEIKEAYSRVQAAVNPENGAQPADPRLLHAWRWIGQAAAKAGYYVPSELSEFVRRSLSRFIGLTPRLVGEAVEYILDFALTFLTLFFFLRDGDRLLHWLRDLVPLGQGPTNELFSKIRDVVRATVFGGLAVAMAQGTIGGLLFWGLGMPTPVLWGVLMGFLSLLPPLGAWLVWVPAGGILIWQGHLLKGVILLAGGAFGISIIDNILRPLIIGQRTQLPTLLVFFSLIGGLQFFGPVGLIVGPVLVALLIGILEFTRLLVQRQAKIPPEQSAPTL